MTKLSPEQLAKLEEFQDPPFRRFKAKDGMVHVVSLLALRFSPPRTSSAEPLENLRYLLKSYCSPCGKVKCKSPKRVRNGRTDEAINCIVCIAAG